MKTVASKLSKLLGTRKAWGIFALIFAFSIYLTSVGELPPLFLAIFAILFLILSTLRVQSFGGNRQTFWWILLPPVFLLSCLLIKETTCNDNLNANKLIRETFVGAVFLIFFLGLGLIYVWGIWTDRNDGKTTKASSQSESRTFNTPSYDDCYRKGVQYFADIGVIILTTPPDEGKFAKDVVEERCRRSPMAFGS